MKALKHSSDTVFDQKDWLNRWDKFTENKRKLRSCRRCLYDESLPQITFDTHGICSYCHTHDSFEKEFSPGSKSALEKFDERVKWIRQQGKHKAYDVVVGVSGGCDSSYLLHLTRELRLRALAVHFDNTWNSEVAVGNIRKMISQLGVELSTFVADASEYDELYRAHLRAGVIDLEAPTDIALAAVLNRAAEKYRVPVFEGHCFRTEGSFPLGWLYMDGRYLADVYRRYGGGRLRHFPNLWLSTQLRWMLWSQIKRIRPLWYLPYDKEKAKELLTRTYGWKWYGGHHLENHMTHFFHTFFLPRRFSIDTRVVGFSALIRSGQMSRVEGERMLREPPSADSSLIKMILGRLKISDEEFQHMMNLPVKTFRDFKNYRTVFRRFRWFFYWMARTERIPMSFYQKYTQ
jgi:hypothetical protein